jgi:NAD(P)H-flavin reductase
LENKVNVGDSIRCEGPTGKTKYEGNGKFISQKKELPKKQKLGLIAGGTGISPLYSIALASSLAKDGLDIQLLFSNKTKDDIIMKE